MSKVLPELIVNEWLVTMKLEPSTADPPDLAITRLKLRFEPLVTVIVWLELPSKVIVNVPLGTRVVILLLNVRLPAKVIFLVPDAAIV